MMQKESLFKALFHSSYQPIIIMDESGIIIQFNTASEKLFLLPSSEAIGQHIHVLLDGPPPAEHQHFIHYLTTYLNPHIIGKGCEITAHQKNGTAVTIFISISKVKIEHHTYFFALITDVASILAEDNTLLNLATWDALTKTYSRNYFETHAHDWFMDYQHKHEPFSLLMLDLNNFKGINDELGHTIGDKLLIAFSKRIQSCLTPRDYLVRLGGDEFLVVQQGDQEQVDYLAKRLLATCEEIYELDGNHISILPSIGVYAQVEITDLSRLLQRTDFALYAAKKSIHPIQFFTPDLEEQFYQQRHLEHLIREAISKEEIFYLMFQPQIDIRLNRIVGFEALLRLNNEGEEIAPEIFIPFIETLGLGEKLNEILLNKLLNLLSKFQWSALKEKIKISFNLSPQVYHFKSHLKHLLQKIELFSNTHPQIYFEIELTESKLIATDMKYLHQWTQIGKLLKKHNIQLAIDDFAREYSSIHRLIEYPVSTLKVDRVFIEQLGNSQDVLMKQILKTFIRLGKALNMTMMVEGVETRQQVTILKRLGYTLVQGYYFYHPLHPKDAFSIANVDAIEGENI